MIETIRAGEKTLTYELIRKKVKNINLHVKADGRIIVTANNRVSKKYIEDFLIRKADWIENSLKKFESRETCCNTEFKPIEGNRIRLLGYEYPVHIETSDENRIEFNKTGIYIQTSNPEDNHSIGIMWDHWFESFIKDMFYQTVKNVYPKFSLYRLPMPVIKIRRMKTRWGSCSVYKEMITLNRALIHAPVECIEYVAAHELAHFLHPDHSRKFYNLLLSIMPDYKERKKLLDQQAIYN